MCFGNPGFSITDEVSPKMSYEREVTNTILQIQQVIKVTNDIDGSSEDTESIISSNECTFLE